MRKMKKIKDVISVILFWAINIILKRFKNNYQLIFSQMN